MFKLYLLLLNSNLLVYMSRFKNGLVLHRSTVIAVVSILDRNLVNPAMKTHSAIEGDWVISGHSLILRLTSITGCCEDKVEEWRVMVLKPDKNKVDLFEM